ncbi:MAG: type II toxin-antitoxin system RelE/ParE family toxin [Bacteroidota bacterium]
MIASFAESNTESIFHGYSVKGIPLEIQNIARRKLRMLNNSTSLQDLKVPPSNKLEKLKGSWKNYYSIRVNIRWRIVFVWKNNQSFEVSLLDYHR